MEVADHPDAKQAAGRGARKSGQVGMPLSEQLGPAFEFSTRLHQGRPAGRRHGFDFHESTGKFRPVVDQERCVVTLAKQPEFPRCSGCREDSPRKVRGHGIGDQRTAGGWPCPCVQRTAYGWLSISRRMVSSRLSCEPCSADSPADNSSGKLIAQYPLRDAIEKRPAAANGYRALSAAFSGRLRKAPQTTGVQGAGHDCRAVSNSASHSASRTPPNRQHPAKGARRATSSAGMSI